MRGALQKLLYVHHPFQRSGDQAVIGWRERDFSNMVHVVSVGFGGRNASRGSMGLLQVAGIGQISHYIPDGCRTKAVFVIARQGTRAHWLTRRNVGFYNGGEDLPFAGTDLSWVHHNLGTPKSFRCKSLDI